MRAPEYADEFRRCLIELDIKGMRAIWSHVAPHLPAGTDEQVLATMHRARTESVTMPLNLRQYSHEWLTERGIPSGLPEKGRPVIVEAVGISVNFSSDVLRSAKPIIERVMADAVEDIYADDAHPDPMFVRGRMADARRKETVKLFGRGFQP